MTTPAGPQSLTDDELEALLEDLEKSLLDDVQNALDATAQDFLYAVDRASELVAARFSVSDIRGMWRRRVGAVMSRLRAISERAAAVVAEEAGSRLPSGWDENLAQSTEATRALLDAVGDRLASEASQTLAEGLNAGEGLEALKNRLSAVFASDGAQLGPGRAERIATTEATRAFNAGVLAAAQALEDPDRPLVKQWITRRDDRVREAHAVTNGQLQLLDDPFDVAGTPMRYPGDPAAPAALTVGCRCILRTSLAERGQEVDRNEAAATLSAAADVSTGAMLALMPTAEDAARLALDGGEEADQLHLTLLYLGDAADWSGPQRGDLIRRVAAAAALYLKPVAARIFGAAQWNPGSDEPAWVWSIGDDLDRDSSRLQDAKDEITYALEEGHSGPQLPQQYSPWAPHICAVYGDGDWTAALADRVGPVTFDRVRVAFAGQYTDIPLTGAALEGLSGVDYPETGNEDESGYGEPPEDSVSAGAATGDYDRVVRHVRKSPVPVSASDAATFLKLPIVAVRRYLARASRKGEIVRIARGTYVKPVQSPAATAVAAAATAVAVDTGRSLDAAATGSVDLPVAPRDAPWDGDAAASRVFDWADGDPGKISRAFAYRDDDADPTTKAAYKLGFADVVDGALTIIPRGVFAAQAAMEGARGGVDLPPDQVDAVRDRLEAVRARVDEVADGEGDDMEASAWSLMRNLPAMPAEWFAAPRDEELPPGGPGVNYRDGRIFGWVAQSGEPHAGYAQRVTIDTLGRIDTSHFLRQRFTLDDGSTVKAGAFTMNVGHHRDGAECETSACQFDDTRTVAGIVTVGMSDRGMWFSGAAAPWLSDWDRAVFLATQPSYHMKKGPSGGWQLRAVLAVPVPGHSSPLLASAVIVRSNMALTASATMVVVDEAVAAAEAVDELAQPDQDQSPAAIDYDRMADALVAALGRAEQKRLEERAELEELLAEGRSLVD